MLDADPDTTARRMLHILTRLSPDPPTAAEAPLVPELCCVRALHQTLRIRRNPNPYDGENAIALCYRIHDPAMRGLITPLDCIACGMIRETEIELIFGPELVGMSCTVYARYQLGRDPTDSIVWGPWSQAKCWTID